MIVVVEGPDRTGKTTLCEGLHDALGWEVIHSGPPSRHPLQEYVLALEERLIHRNLILDRWHLGEWVYPQLYPTGRRPLPAGYWLWIELFLRARGALLIVMNDDPADIKQRVSEDDDSYLKLQQVEGCVTLFSQALAHSILNKFQCSISFTEIDKVTETIKRFPTALYAPEPRMLGMPPYRRQGIMLVGDELGRPNPPEATHQVPFAPYPQASGQFLMSALVTWPQHLQQKLQIVNSLRPDGNDEDLHGLVKRFEPEAVVALGQRAADRLSEQGVDHTRVQHPQYMRRFKFNQLSQYSNQILKEAGFDRR